MSRDRRLGIRDSMASADEIFAWVSELHAFGLRDRYGYRMPGTPADHTAARFIADKLRSFGLDQVHLEPIPLAVAFPDSWHLVVTGLGPIPCCFVRYAGYTPESGVTAPLVYVGRGSEEDFRKVDVKSKIVVVDLVTDGVVPPMGTTHFVHDPDGAIPDERGRAAWPLGNMASSYTGASERGACGWIGILNLFGDDTNEYLHWYAQYEMPAVTVSCASGKQLRHLAAQGAMATLTLTGTRGQGVGYNVYGRIPGRTDGEVIVLKTHYDGWATNEASGAAVTLATAANLASRQGPSLNRSVLVFFRASHFGVSWSLGPDSWHVPRSMAASIYGLRPDWEQYECLAETLMPQTAVVNNIEMIGRRYRWRETGWSALDEPAVRYWGITGPPGGANPFLLEAVSNAIVRHGLSASQVSNFLIGDAWDYAKLGIPLVNFISHNVWQFTRKDTLDTVLVRDLPLAASAFVDIIRAEDQVPAELLRPVADVPFSVPPGG